MEFTNQDKINYTLGGYFMKVANMIILSRPLQALKYLYTHEDHLFNMKKHIYSKSLSSLLMFVLNSRSELLNKVGNAKKAKDFFAEFNDLRVRLLTALVTTCCESVGVRDQLEIHLSSAIIVNDAIQNVNLIADGEILIKKLFEDGTLIKLLFEKTDPEKSNNIGSIGQVLTNLINLVKNNPGKFDAIGKRKEINLNSGFGEEVFVMR